MYIWILTEERPKKSVIHRIIYKFTQDHKLKFNVEKIRIIPVIDENRFKFKYEVLGTTIDSITRIFIKIISGKSSFVDFLVFLEENKPNSDSNPFYVIEETKTTDAESRNTGVFQRCSKFVFVKFYYPYSKKIMLYNMQTEDNKKPTDTNIFGTRLLLTIGVEILGKKLDTNIFKPFSSVEELIQHKNRMRRPPKGNVPILISKTKDTIKVSGRLYKAGGLSHDPNIGALSIICQTLRDLGWKGKIVITQHGLKQNHLTGRNKFIRIANRLDLELEGLDRPKASIPQKYWYYDETSEKEASILLHLLAEDMNSIDVIYENHAGCERGFFKKINGDCIAIHKYILNDKKNGIVKIPDLIILDNKRKSILILEAKTGANMDQGLEEVKEFGDIEKEYIKKYYPNFSISRHLVLFGGEENINNENVAFILTSDGRVLTSDNTPETIIEIVQNHFADEIKKGLENFSEKQ